MSDEDDELAPASPDEEREAEALARALLGEVDPDAPGDARATAALLRSVGGARAVEDRVREVEREVFPTETSRLGASRPRAYAWALLASAAAIAITVGLVQLESFGSRNAPPASRAATRGAASPSSGSLLGLLAAERALLMAPPEARAAAFKTLRAEAARARDERLLAMLARHGGKP